MTAALESTAILNTAGNKTFPCFGEPIEVLVSAKSTGGAASIITQICQPGGGPPPHWHDNEDELFTVVSGRFELLSNGVYTEIPAGQWVFAPRGQVHTFRNCGDTEGKIMCVAMPGNLDEYLEAISTIQMPQDAAELFRISDGYGIHFMPPSA